MKVSDQRTIRLFYNDINYQNRANKNPYIISYSVDWGIRIH